MRIPFLRPRPARLSRLTNELEAIEESGLYSNYGPVNARFEAAMTKQMFNGLGGCLTVNNATTGLMIAIQEAVTPSEGRRFALMPSFTFAATAQAALWAGLTPLLCDIDPVTWNACPDAEDNLLRTYGDQIACIVPYACFGNGIDLNRYARLARDLSVGIVVDAAASLGSLDQAGKGFGAGFPHAIVYSMHATKTFSTSEGGLIHCGDMERLGRLRAMGNFGFDTPRVATMMGLNAKLSEIGALLGLAKLEDFETIVSHRNFLATTYRRHLPGLTYQLPVGQRLAYQFMPALLPKSCVVRRSDIIGELASAGIGTAHYFSPHLMEQQFFAHRCVAGDLSQTNQLAARAISLPLSDDMTETDVEYVCQAVHKCLTINVQS